MYELLHDAPIPDKVYRSRYPFKKMQVGDSFIVPNRHVNTVKNAAQRWRDRYAPWCFRMAKDTQGNWRLWRVPDTPIHVKSRY